MTLSVQRLGVSYGRHRIITDLDLTFDAGQVVGILGPNGSGKSTFIRAVAGVQPCTGEVSVAGKTGTDARDLLGYMPQEVPAQVALTVLESVLVALRTGRIGRVGRTGERRALAVLDALDIGHLCDAWLGECSGGQRQLVSLAQTLVREPTVLLLDEPTSALDLRHQRTVFDAVRHHVDTVSDGLALVAVHDLNLAARHCDSFVLLRDGELHAQGSPEEILQPGVLDEVYDVPTTVTSIDGHRIVTV